MTDNPHEAMGKYLRDQFRQMSQAWAEQIDREIMGTSTDPEPEEEPSLEVLSNLMINYRPPHNRDMLVMHPDTWHKTGLNERDLGAVRLAISSYVPRREMFIVDSSYISFPSRLDTESDVSIMYTRAVYIILALALIVLTLLIGLLI